MEAKISLNSLTCEGSATLDILKLAMRNSEHFIWRLKWNYHVTFNWCMYLTTFWWLNNPLVRKRPFLNELLGPWDFVENLTFTVGMSILGTIWGFLYLLLAVSCKYKYCVHVDINNGTTYVKILQALVPLRLKLHDDSHSHFHTDHS